MSGETPRGRTWMPISVPRRTTAIFLVTLVLLSVAGFYLYVVYSSTYTNDGCLWGPRLEQPQVGAHATVINVSAHRNETWDFRFYRAAIWVNDTNAGELNPLAAGVPAGPMTYEDADGDHWITRGDYFRVGTIPRTEYRIELHWDSCPYPQAEAWAT